ncbi:hypothetical protein NHX12_005582 [Muraenolepis orangiensis]|uniref:Kinesin motor domain-containing protein n=1 Tax=Muraenolepis orangiensis TaxID=630683 RepID=A0A9Q0IAI1_9TELE|nr:hypothetical protein NHX12_005582 [Muraenolepis orangiensis]
MTTDMCKVFVRVRPLNSMEVDGNMSKVVHVVDDRTLLLEEKVRLDVTQRTQNVSDTKDLAFGFNKVFGEDSTQAEATCKHYQRIASLKTQQQHIYKKQTEARKSFQNNTARLLVVENQMKVLAKDLHCLKLELQVKDLKQHIEHMIQLAALQDLENIHVHKMLNLSLAAHNDPTLHQQLAAQLTIWADLEESCVEESDGSGAADEASDASSPATAADASSSAEEASDEAAADAAPGKLAPILTFSHLP